MRRRLRLALVAAFLVVAGTVAWATLSHRPLITREQYNRIQPGMTLADVEAVFGVPPGDYTSSSRPPATNSGSFPEGPPHPDGATFIQWAAEACTPQLQPGGNEHVRMALGIRVYFDEQGQVASKDVTFSKYSSITALGQIRVWVRIARDKLGV
jgi:hypothetical protein